MRDLDKERELLHKAGLAGAGGHSEALAASSKLSPPAAVGVDPTTLPAKGHRGFLAAFTLVYFV